MSTITSGTDETTAGSASGWPAVVAVTGADAEKFLQAQLTCDVALAAPGKGIPFAWCTSAGRVRASGWLLRGDARFFLLAGAAGGQALASALSRFIFRDRVVITPDEFFADEAPDDDARANDEVFLMPGNPARRISVSRGSSASREPENYLLGGIRSGTCELPAALEGRFIPQMLNLDLTGGVSFTKGCYPGQEIVARTHNLGRVKRRMLRFSSAAPCIPPGTELYSGSNRAGECLVSAADGTGCELLAVVKLDETDLESLHTVHRSEAPLRLLTLPYAIPELPD